METALTIGIPLLSSLIGGCVAGLITVAAMKTDVRWLKELVQQHNNRIYNLERAK